MVRRNAPEFYGLLSIVVFLVTIGFVFVASSSYPVGIVSFSKPQPFYFVFKEAKNLLLGAAAGIIVFYLARKLDIFKLSFFAWLFSYFLVLLTFVPGLARESHGAQRWLILGFQPSELLKITVVLAGVYLVLKAERDPRLRKKYLINFYLLVYLSALTVLLQKDLSTAAVIAAAGLIVLFLSRLSILHVMVNFGVLMLGAAAAVLTEGYRLKRLVAFIDPWADPASSGYQIIQSLYALARGGLTGEGLTRSTQKFLYLPDAHTDFIFSIIGEELGLIGTLSIIFLFLAFLITGVRLANKCKNEYCKRVSMGLVFVITMQALINIGAATGMLPVTGIPLPFISYGGTSLISSMMIVGLLLAFASGVEYESASVRRRNKRSRPARVSSRKIAPAGRSAD